MSDNLQTVIHGDNSGALKTSPIASTLSEIEARLRELNDGPNDVSDLVVIEHKASKLLFHVGAMTRVEYDTWTNLRLFEEAQWRDGGGEKSGAPILYPRADAYLLCNAVWTQDGQKLTEELVQMLLDGKRFGPSTSAVIAAAHGANPPRAQMVWALQQCFGANQAFLVIVRVLEKMGLFKLLLDSVAGDGPEKEFALREIGKVEETLIFFEAIFQAQEAAKEMDIETYEKYDIGG